MSKDRIIEHIIEGDCLLRDWLRRKYSGRRIHFLRDKGCLSLNGEPATVVDRAKEGDKITLVFKENENFDYLPVDMGLSMVYEDEDILIVHKPEGVASMPVAPHFSANLLNGLKFLFPDGVFRVVTRLDKDTSGLVLVAKNALSHSILHKEIRSIKKTYAALVEGRVSAPFVIDAPIANTDGAKRRVGDGGKSAITRVIAAESMGENTLVTLEAVTGRTHQIRVHLSHLGHPIVGDALYDSGTGGGQLLACVGLEFCHPVTHENLRFFVDGKSEIGRRSSIFTINSQKTL